jgi:hypothetical protein
MPSYGYAYTGRVLNYDSARQGYYLESVALAPDSRWGPVPSCVPGLIKGDRVVMVSTGTSRDDLIIVAKVGADFPDIGSIPGLQAALDAKLDDFQLDQASGVAALDAGRKVAYARLPIGTVVSTVAAGDDARMTNARTPTAHASTHATGGTDPITPASIGAGDAATTATNNANIAAIAGREEFDGQKYFRLFGDAVTSMPRFQGTTASALMSTGNAYAFTLASSKPITMLNAHLSVLSGGGTTTAVASVYQGATAGSPLSLVSTGPTQTPLNGNWPFQCAPTASPFVVNAGYVLVVIQIVSGSIIVGGSASLDSTMLLGAGSMRVAAVKALTGTPPSTINTADGTWSYFSSMPWVALD